MGPVQEQIAPAIFQALITQASAEGLSINDYLAQLLGLRNGHSIETASGEGAASRPFYETASEDEWVKALHAWGESHGPNTAGLTSIDVSRESIYEDR
jgi:hypothetical protein